MGDIGRWGWGWGDSGTGIRVGNARVGGVVVVHPCGEVLEGGVLDGFDGGVDGVADGEVRAVETV